MWAKSLAWCSNRPLDLSSKSDNLWTYSCSVSVGCCCWSNQHRCCMLFSSYWTKIIMQSFLILLHRIEGGNKLIVLLNNPWDFPSHNLYGSLLVRAPTLLTYSGQTLKDWGSLGLKIVMSFIKCWVFWKVGDLAMFCKACIICWWRCQVLCIISIWCQNSSTSDWLKSNGVRFGHCWPT